MIAWLDGLNNVKTMQIYIGLMLNLTIVMDSRNYQSTRSEFSDFKIVTGIT
jgi:hypothetical protein